MARLDRALEELDAVICAATAGRHIEIAKAGLFLPMAASEFASNPGSLSATERERVQRKVLALCDAASVLEQRLRPAAAAGSPTDEAAHTMLLSAASALGHCCLLLEGAGLTGATPIRLCQVAGTCILGAATLHLQSAVRAAHAAVPDARASWIALAPAGVHLEVMDMLTWMLFEPQHEPARVAFGVVARQDGLARWAAAVTEALLIDPSLSGHAGSLARRLTHVLDRLSTDEFAPCGELLATSAVLQPLLQRMLLQAALPLAVDRVLAAAAKPAAVGSGSGRDALPKGLAAAVARFLQPGREKHHDEEDARWLGSLLALLNRKSGQPLLRLHVSTGGPRAAGRLLELSGRLLERVPLGPGACTIQAPTAGNLHVAAVTLLAAVLAAVKARGDAGQREALGHAVVQVWRLVPAAAASTQLLLRQPDAHDCPPAMLASLFFNLFSALDAGSSYMQSGPLPAFQTSTAAALVDAAEAGLRLLPQVAQAQLSWMAVQQTAAELAAYGMDDAAPELAHSVLIMVEQAAAAAEQQCHVTPPARCNDVAAELAPHLLRLHRAATRAAHYAATAAGEPTLRALPELGNHAFLFVSLHRLFTALVPLCRQAVEAPTVPEEEREALRRQLQASLAAHVMALEMLIPGAEAQRGGKVAVTSNEVTCALCTLASVVVRDAPAHTVDQLAGLLVKRLQAGEVNSQQAMQLLQTCCKSGRLTAALATPELLIAKLLPRANQCGNNTAATTKTVLQHLLAAGCSIRRAADVTLDSLDSTSTADKSCLQALLSSLKGLRAAVGSVMSTSSSQQQHAEQQRVLGSALCSLAATLQSIWQLSRQVSTAGLELAKVAAARPCAYLRCANVVAGGGPAERRQRCGACRTAYYCSTACSHADWAVGHKRACKLLAAERAEERASKGAAAQGSMQAGAG